MRIITCNLPEQFLHIIDKLTGTDRLYPSRSELIRVAVHEYLVKELQSLDHFAKLKNLKSEKPKKPVKKETFNDNSRIEKLFKTLNIE